MQKNLKLISCRIHPDTLDQIDDFSKDHRYWTRNTIINSVLGAVFRNFSKRQIYDMVRQDTERPEPVVCDFKIVDLMHPSNTNSDGKNQ